MSASDSSQSHTTSEENTVLDQQLAALTTAILHRPPYCQGTIPLPVVDFTLFYGKDSQARRVNLANASPEELQHLAETCDPATFGVAQRDVYDESYRKAGKLNVGDFSLSFSPDAIGLLDTVRLELLADGGKPVDNVRAELYKLNVYGPQSFFKAHVDTPRSELMFGSLVVVFPTAHEGGALAIREVSEEQPREWMFDSAALLAQAAAPSIAYVAFYSDVEHEVMPIQSGYRVTVTYNLYYVKDNADGAPNSPPAALPVAAHEDTFKATLKTLLDDPTFLPDGGNLIFALRHQYPLSTARQGRQAAKAALSAVADRLKASDALVFKVVRELSLDAALKIVYQDEDDSWRGRYVICDQVAQIKDKYMEEELASFLSRKAGGLVVDTTAGRYEDEDEDEQCTVEAHWIAFQPWTHMNSTKEAFIVYGNEASISYAYWKVNLFVRIGPTGSRATA